MNTITKNESGGTDPFAQWEKSPDGILDSRGISVVLDPMGLGRGWTAVRAGEDEKGPFEQWIGDFFPDRDAAVAAALKWGGTIEVTESNGAFTRFTGTQEEIAGASAYLRRHVELPAGPLIRIYLVNFRAGVDLNKVPLPPRSAEQMPALNREGGVR